MVAFAFCLSACRSDPRSLKNLIDRSIKTDVANSDPRDPVPLTRFSWGAAVVIYAFALMNRAPFALAAVVANPTGLPVYPNVARTQLEDRLRTDDLGRWCMHFSAQSLDSLTSVEDWYRHALSTADETDLSHDRDYKSSYAAVEGIKLTMNLAFVAVYKASTGAATSIDIVRCGPLR